MHGQIPCSSGKFSVKPWYDHGNAYNEQDRAEDPYDRFVI